MRGNLLEILGQQYVTTARAKGLTETHRRQQVRRARRDQPADQRHGHAAAEPDLGRHILGIVLSLPTIGPLFYNAL